jgi:RHS repeat-associated protein
MPILMSKRTRNSGATLLDETAYTYASDTANLGRLTQRVRTHHDGSSFATAEVFTYAADPNLTGALLSTRTLTSHDGLKVVSNQSHSALTGQLWRQTDARGVVTAYTYDALGRMLSRTIDPGGSYASTMTFDHVITGGTEEAFQVLATDCNGNKRCQGLDGAGRAVYTAPNSVDDGLSDPDPQHYQTASRTYDALGRVIKSTQADWLFKTPQDQADGAPHPQEGWASQDQADWVPQDQNDGAPQNQNDGALQAQEGWASRDQEDWALETQEQYARTGIPSYDDWGQSYRMDYDDGTWTSQARDPIALTVTSALGGTNTQGTVASGLVVRTYDVSGKLLKVARYAANADPSTATPYSTRTMAYDGLHRLRVQTDALGQATAYDYDNWNRLIKTTLADGTVLTRSYSADSAAANVVKITVTNTALKLAETATGTRVFDGLGRVTSATIGGRAWAYQYDAPSADSMLMDARPTRATAPDGTVRKYTYIAALGDKIGQVQVYQDASLAQLLITQSFTYNAATGALTSAVEGVTSKAYTPHASGRLKNQSVTLDGNSCSMSYDHYTLRGRLCQYTHVDAAVRVTSHNPNGTVSQVSDGAMQVTLGYDPAGRLISWTATDLSGATPALTTTLTLDDYGRETARSIAAPGDDPNKPSWQITQNWNVADQLTNRQTNRLGATYRIEQYLYDNRNRLKYWSGVGTGVTDRYGNALRTQTFTPDPFGNITQVVSTFPRDSNTVTNTATFTYNDKTDPCRLVSFTNSDSSYPGSGTLAYDATGRITDDGMGQSLGYDALGRLTTATSTLTGHSGSYVYDAHNRLSSQTVDGKVSDFYYKANALVNLVQDGDSRRLLRSPAGCTSQYGPGGVWLTVTDAAGSVLATTQGAAQGGTTETYGYSAYGEDQPGSRSSTLGYTGQYHDPLTPGYQLGNGYRAYLPALMRFTGPDSLSPFGAGGINAYAYCSGDPVNHADPSGHFNLDVIAQDWGTAWRAIGRDLHAADPVPWINKLASKGTTPAVGWYMGQKWARYTPLYWALYGLGTAAHAAQPVTNTFGWMSDLAMVVPGVDEADEADEVLQGVGDVAYDAYDASTDTSYSTEPVTTSGRIEGDAEPLQNYGARPSRHLGDRVPLVAAAEEEEAAAEEEEAAEAARAAAAVRAEAQAMWNRLLGIDDQSTFNAEMEKIMGNPRQKKILDDLVRRPYGLLNSPRTNGFFTQNYVFNSLVGGVRRRRGFIDSGY